MGGTTMLQESERYWLAHSEGFRVDSDGGRVGIVETVIESGPEQAAALVVRAGMLGMRLVLVPAEEVASVTPRRKRLRVRASPAVGTGGFVHDLVGRVRRNGRGTLSASGV
jgi:hypothetical protein